MKARVIGAAETYIQKIKQTGGVNPVPRSKRNKAAGTSTVETNIRGGQLTLANYAIQAPQRVETQPSAARVAAPPIREKKSRN